MAQHSMWRQQHVAEPLLHVPLALLSFMGGPLNFCGLGKEDGRVSVVSVAHVGVAYLVGC